MRTKILYVIVSGADDYYMEQLLVSVYSARHHNPSAHVEILMDKTTFDSLPGRGELSRTLEELSSHITVADLDPSLSKKRRSRMLKTGMREYVEGDFLFLDCDTIVTASLEGIDAIEGSVAACLDSHCLFKDNPYRRADIQMCRKIGIDISYEKNFFNSGVIFSRDDLKSREFFQKWSSFYSEGFQKGVTQDQPAFNKADILLGRIIQVLDDVWNCELKHGVRFLRDALVVHYLCSLPDPGREYFVMNDREVLQRIKESGRVPEEIAALADNPFTGIPPLTRLFAGEDLELFSTLRFRHLRRIHKKGRHSIADFILRVYYHFVGYGGL